jgi:DNA-binding IclR family transcriptional regulator
MLSGEMTHLAASPAMNGRVQAMAKAAAVLNCGAPRTPLLSIRESTRATGIPRSTVHALCVWRPGHLAIGAPVGAGDAVVGGISVVGPNSVFTPQVTARLAARLVSVAPRVGERLTASA